MLQLNSLPLRLSTTEQLESLGGGCILELWTGSLSHRPSTSTTHIAQGRLEIINGWLLWAVSRNKLVQLLTLFKINVNNKLKSRNRKGFKATKYQALSFPPHPLKINNNNNKIPKIKYPMKYYQKRIVLQWNQQKYKAKTRNQFYIKMHKFNVFNLFFKLLFS